MNPVIPGDHPDATLTRVGNAFYTTGSSFNPTPVIYHSTDLVHWEAIAQPVSASWSNYGITPGGGCWGGHLVYYKGTYWDFFSRAGSMYFVKADDPRGPWSQPVKLNNPSNLPYGLGGDNSIFIDDDNKWYLIVKNGQPNNGIVELGDNGQPTGVVYNLNWLNPSPAYPYSWAEGPVMWKSFGYYYYSFARDLSGGQKVMRSPTLTAVQDSWEMQGDFFNVSDPLKNGALFTEPNHSSPAVMLDDSTVWVIHPLYAKGEWKGQGRQGLLNQVHYNSNKKPAADYPVNKPFAAPKLPSSGIPWMVPKSDFFNSSILNPEWSFLGYTPDHTYSLIERQGWLRLSPNSNKLNAVVKNDGEHNYSLITHLEFDAKSTNDEAGLRIIRGDESKYVKLYSSINSSNKKVIIFSFESNKFEAENPWGNSLWLKIVRVNHNISGYFSKNGVEWTQVGQSFKVSVMDSYSDFTTWAGTRQGLYVKNSPAYFDLYIYRDAYTPILAGCPANQSGTFQTSTSALDSIHNNDWVLYAGVEFGNKEYGKAADSVQIIASSLIGGQAEVWLDSINTGTIIGTCSITPTGNWNTFKTFRAKVNPTTGRHDVYLKFIGSEGNLFQVKWIQFTAKTAPHYVSSITTSDSTIVVKLDIKVIAPQLPHGFKITRNNSENDSITKVFSNPDDSSEIILTIYKNLIYSDNITISYNSGSIQTKEGMDLVAFSNSLVNNILPDPTPRIISAESNFSGDSLLLQFNKKMKSTNSYISGFQLFKNYLSNIPIDSILSDLTDSTTYILKINSTIFFEDTITISYSGTEILSYDGYALGQFSTLPVINNSRGYPPLLSEGYIVKNDSLWNGITLRFNRPLTDNFSTQKEFFLIEINEQNALINTLSGNYDSIEFTFSPAVVFGDEVEISYSGGSISSLNYGLLADITGYSIANNIPLPVNTNDLRLNNKVTIYPVPVQNEMKIVSETEFNELRIYNTEGEIVLNKQFYTSLNSTSLKVNLNKGVYVIELINPESSFGLKLLVE